VKYAGLVLANFRRHKLRTAMTVLSILVAFLLFGYLAAIRKAFEMGVSVAGADRLVVRHKVSIINLMPAHYEAQIEQIEGVANATPATWFGAIYRDERNFFPQIAVNPNEWLQLYPEYIIPEERQKVWAATRTGVIVGRRIAERFGWKVGDKIPMKATIWRPKAGGATWTFDVIAIYDGAARETDLTQMFLQQAYLQENNVWGPGQVGWYHIKVGDPKHAEAIAKKIDAVFANSPAETKTETEGAFVKAFADQVGNIGAIVTAILTVAFFMILLVAGNTMAQSVRERMSELGVMKAIGFTDGQVLGLVIAESLLIAIAGGGIGLLLGWIGVSQGDPTGGMLPVFFFPPKQLAIGAIAVLMLGIVAGLLPALQAMRLNAVDALRRE
jgi:putative ABC transport system permease protein